MQNDEVKGMILLFENETLQTNRTSFYTIHATPLLFSPILCFLFPFCSPRGVRSTHISISFNRSLYRANHPKEHKKSGLFLDCYARRIFITREWQALISCGKGRGLILQRLDVLGGCYRLRSPKAIGRRWGFSFSRIIRLALFPVLFEAIVLSRCSGFPCQGYF